MLWREVEVRGEFRGKLGGGELWGGIKGEVEGWSMQQQLL